MKFAIIIICGLLSMPVQKSLASEQFRLYANLQKKTEEHIQYLSSIGLGERAQSIQLLWFQPDDTPSEEKIDLAAFTQHTCIPQEVLLFDPHQKNTLITTAPDAQRNQPEDLKKILDIRLYPVLRDLILSHKVEVFLGTKKEMAAYYRAKEVDLFLEFKIPSSATYYLAQSREGELSVIMSGLVSRENLIAQLITLKLADLPLDNIEIIGEISHFTQLVTDDIRILLRQVPELKKAYQALIIAGCGLEETVSQIIYSALPSNIGKILKFKGDIVSLLYLPLVKPINGISGFISLNLNYGEITEEITKQILENCPCKYVFTGSAGGYIPRSPDDPQKPPIGSRVQITTSLHESGEVVTISKSKSPNKQPSLIHLHVSSIFMETYDWLEEAKRHGGTSVDIETFYIMRAIRNYNAQYHPQVEADCGYFVSDYVGEVPLRDYSTVFREYPQILYRFLTRVLGTLDPFL